MQHAQECTNERQPKLHASAQKQRKRRRDREKTKQRERERAGVTSPIPVGAEHTVCVRALVTEETLKKVEFSKQREMHNDWQNKMRVEDQDEAGMSSEFGEE